MGLDVFLYKCKDREAVRVIEEQYRVESDKLWKEAGGYDKMTEAERQDTHAKTRALAESLGLGEWGESKECIQIEQDSVRYPNHLFKVGYFRSSYNDGGINSVAERYGLPSLYEIFDSPDKYEFTPNWEESLARVKDAIRQWQETNDSAAAKYDVTVVDRMRFAGQKIVSSQEEALQIFNTERTKDNALGGAYSNRDGSFYLYGLKCFAFIGGQQFGTDCTYVIHEAEGLNWYIQALEIVQETVEYVLAQPDREDYYLHWSG